MNNRLAMETLGGYSFKKEDIKPAYLTLQKRYCYQVR
jgi:hypothetical protein